MTSKAWQKATHILVLLQFCCCCPGVSTSLLIIHRRLWPSEAKHRQAACVISPAAGWQPPAESHHAHTEAAAAPVTAGHSSRATPQISTHGRVWGTKNATEDPPAALVDCHVLHHPRWLKRVQQGAHAKMVYNYGSRLSLPHFVFAISLRLFLSEETAICSGVSCWIVSVEGETGQNED